MFNLTLSKRQSFSRAINIWHGKSKCSGTPFNTPPIVFRLPHHELEWVTSIDGSTAANNRNNKQVFSILNNATTDPQARSWLVNNNGQATGNGCQGWFNIEYEGQCYVFTFFDDGLVHKLQKLIMIMINLLTNSKSRSWLWSTCLKTSEVDHDHDWLVHKLQKSIIVHKRVWLQSNLIMS